MIKLLARGLLVLLGAALTVITVQHALKIDRFAATQPVTGRAEPSDRTPRKLEQAFVHSPDDTGDVADATTPVRTDRRRTSREPLSGVGTSNDRQSNVITDYDARAGAPTFGLALPKRAGAGAGGASAASASADPTGTTTQPAQPMSGAPAQGCKHELGIQAQGITAQVDFVGTLLNGQENSGQTFSGAQLSDLKILVQWQNLFQNHLQRLDFIAPDGSLYQSLSRPLTATDGDAPVETLLPVNGTWITRYSLYGAWCVEAFLDQEQEPVASSRLVISAQR